MNLIIYDFALFGTLWLAVLCLDWLWCLSNFVINKIKFTKFYLIFIHYDGIFKATPVTWAVLWAIRTKVGPTLVQQKQKIKFFFYFSVDYLVSTTSPRLSVCLYLSRLSCLLTVNWTLPGSEVTDGPPKRHKTMLHQFHAIALHFSVQRVNTESLNNQTQLKLEREFHCTGIIVFYTSMNNLAQQS